PSGASIVVPTAALQQSQQGTAVYVYRPNKTVDFIPVKVKRTLENRAAIEGDVHPGDQVVTDGQLQLTPGSKVRIAPEGNGGLGAGDHASVFNPAAGPSDTATGSPGGAPGDGGGSWQGGATGAWQGGANGNGQSGAGGGWQGRAHGHGHRGWRADRGTST